MVMKIDCFFILKKIAYRKQETSFVSLKTEPWAEAIAILSVDGVFIGEDPYLIFERVPI